MSSVPDDKQGVASAVNDTTREVGAALGYRLDRLDAGLGIHRRVVPAVIGVPGTGPAAATRVAGRGARVWLPGSARRGNNSSMPAGRPS